jgi:hypothetical protein
VKLDPSKRFLTIILASGTLVLLAAVAIGQSMGDRVIGQVTEHRLNSLSTIDVTPAPLATTAPYGPNWQRTQALAAAPDPGFPDPRVPPQALPVVQTSAPAARVVKAATPTPNPKLPVWRQKPLPIKALVRTPAPQTPEPTVQPSPQL